MFMWMFGSVPGKSEKASKVSSYQVLLAKESPKDILDLMTSQLDLFSWETLQSQNAKRYAYREANKTKQNKTNINFCKQSTIT